MYPVV